MAGINKNIKIFKHKKQNRHTSSISLNIKHAAVSILTDMALRVLKEVSAC